MRPDKEAEEYRSVNDANTVGVCPVVNAAGQRPRGLYNVEFLEYAAKLARTEWGTPIDVPAVYVWLMNYGEHCNWVGLSKRHAGQYPDEAIVVAGRVDSQLELVP